MSNFIYDTGRAAFLNAGINWTSDNIKAALVDTTKYTANSATDQYLSTISGISGAIISTSPNLTSKTSAAGVASSAAWTWSAVTGAVANAFVIYKDTGTAATSQLIAYIDTATGLPVTPNGGDITFTPDTGTNHIFKL